MDEASNYWVQYLKDVERCSFPALNDGWDEHNDDRVYALDIELGSRTTFDAFTQRTRLTSTTVIQAAWALTLRSYVGADTICFGVQNRGSGALFPFVAELRPVDTCWSLLGEIQSWANKCPTRVGQPEGFNQRLSTLFNNVVEFEKSAPSTMDVVVSVDLDAGRASFNSRRSVVAEAQAANVISAFEQALLTILQNPRCCISKLDLFTPHHAALIESWGSVELESKDECMHDCVRTHAQQRPDALAISSWDEGEWSYRDLERYVDALASLLRKDVRSEARIAMLFTKSAWSVVALLAILKIGATVVPLDPSQPLQRLNQIIENCQVALVLSSTDLATHVAVRTLAVSHKTLADIAQPVSETAPVSPATIAWILSTSGSTGQPKGVMLSHRAFASAFHLLADRFQVDDSTCVLQFASFNHIISLFEVFSALVPGGRLVIPSVHEQQNNLGKCFRGITFTILTPSVLNQINPEDVSTLRTVASAGEPMRPEIIRKWASKLRLINQWGATETVVVAVSDPMRLPSQADQAGRCLGHCRVVDVANRRVPIGAIGEMLFQAPWNSDGYVNDTALTAKSFLSIDNGRWYKTGDLVRQNSDGTLVLAGRKDSMVKLRGLRIDLSEIYQAIARSAEEATVFVATDGPCTNRLVAAIVLRSIPTKEHITLLHGPALRDAASWVEETKAALLQRLPSYMVPTVWLMLARMPLTASGKMDQMAVKRFVSRMTPETFDQVTAMGVENEGPVTEQEKALQRVWSSVLHLPIDRIPRNQSFLALGGDSLAAMSVRAQCLREGMELSVQDILRYPTIMELATHIRGKVDVILNEEWQRLRNETRQSIVERGLLQPSEIEDAYPCTPVQQGMLLSQYRGAGDYDVMEVFEADGTVSADKIRSAWQAVVARHAVLRTIFFESTVQGGVFDQVVLKEVDPRVTILICDSIQELANHPLQPYPDRRPAHDLTVLQTPGKTYLRFHISHTLIDGPSMALITHDLAIAYNTHIDPLPAVFSDYVGRLSTLDDSVEYWTETLAGIQPCCIPNLVDRVSTNHLESISTLLPESLIKFCQSEEVTLPSLLKTVWACVLSAYTGMDDVCFGYLVSGRDTPLLESAVGPFINMLICKIRVDGRSILDVTRSEQRQYTQNLAHQHCSFAAIQHGLEFTGQRLFNSTLSIFRSFEPTHGLQLRKLDSINKLDSEYSTEFDVSLVIQTSASKVSVDLSYWTASISTTHAKHLLDAFVQGLASAVQNPTVSASRLDLVSPRSFEQMIDWNSAGIEMRACVHDLISAQAMETPDAVAIESWDGRLTFKQLEQVSNVVAHALVLQGVEPERHVILCSEKRLLAIVAIVAVLKAGGSLVCIDPANPEARSQKIVDDTSPACILTSPLHAREFEQAMIVDDLLALSQDTTPVCSPVQPHNSALVLFTSGSTGVPKGIVHEHRAIATSLFALRERLHLHSTARILQFSAFTFDASFTETFGALVFGGCLVVPSEEDRLGDMESVINKHNVNWAILTPTVASTLNPEYVPSLQSLTLTGELLKDHNIATWSHINLTNLYGPAEVMHVTTLKELRKNDRVRDIGNGIGVSTWIVDPTEPDRLMPIGATGELLVEGPTLAREYLKDPVTTAEAFRRPRWRPVRLYRTGDLVRYNSDGSLYLLGRRDTQIKLHGQRIELEEIEFQLKQGSTSLGLGRSAAIFAASEENGILAAVVEMERGVAWDEQPSSDGRMAILADLKKFIRNAIPRYMVPSLYVPIQAMPQLSSGKLDRKALATMVAQLSREDKLRFSLARDRAPTQAPGTWMERILAILWSRILRIPVETIAVDDHFFRLGGDSVVAMKLSALAREEHLAISVRSIFQEPQLNSMASSVSLWSERTLQQLEKYQLRRSRIQDIYPCTTTQTGLVLSSVALQGSFISNHVLEVAGLNIDVFKRAWIQFQVRHDIMRSRIIDLGQTVGHVQVVVADVPELSAHDYLDTYLRECKDYNFKYGQPLHSACLVEDCFVWTVHQSIYDHRSIELMCHEVLEIYRHLQIDGSPLETSMVSYKSYVEHTLHCNIPDAETYWSRTLSIDASTYPVTSHNFWPLADTQRSHSFSLPTLSPYVLHGAWAFLLSKYAGYTEHVVFGVTNDGRDELEASTLIGPTTSLVPLVTSVSEEVTVSEFLQGINDSFDSAKPYRHFGLQNMKMLSPTVQDACNFGSLLTVNEASKSGVRTIPAPASYPITLECEVDNERVVVNAQHDARITSSEQMQRMLWQFAHVARQMVRWPDTKLGDIQAMSPEDGHVLKEQNSHIPLKIRSTVHDIIARQGSISPIAEALCSRSESMTYAEMEQFSETLASYLQTEFAIKTGSVVPLAFSRSPWTIIAMLAVSKLGGTFLPLDPSYPASRLRQITESTKLSLLLCSPDYEELAQKLHTVVLPVDAERVRSMPVMKRRIVPVAFDDIAYLIFTSGSTGKPKGIPVEHGAFCTAAIELGARLNLNDQSRAFHFASYAFDASLADSLVVLARGGCVCIPTEAERLEDTTMSMREMRVNWADFTPSFVRTFQPSEVPLLETLVLGGEKLGLDNVALWADKVRLTNVYGPAEACFATTVYAPIHVGDPPDLIGTSCVGAVWIVDPNDVRKLAPVGCIGELVIEGAAVGRGYLDRDRTEEAFVDNPHWLHPVANGTASNGISCNKHPNGLGKPGPLENKKVYKTGDLGRYDLSDQFNGSIRIVGRKDTQVKIRGQRVELGDIEQHIKLALPQAKHVAVEQASVAIREQQQIAAFICFDETQNGLLQVIPSDVRHELLRLEATLRTTIPSYMIPSLYIVLTRMPRSASGKTDRNKLREIVFNLTHEQIAHYSLSEGTQSIPETDVEKRLAAAWSHALNIPVHTISREDSFFKLGGDSIAALRMTTVAQASQLLLTVAQVFKAPKLAQMAASTGIDETPRKEIEPFSLTPDASDLLPQIEAQYGISQSAIQDVLPVTPLQEGLMLLSLKTPGSYVSQTILTLQAHIDLERFQSAWKQVAQRNAILRTTIVHTGSRTLQVVQKEQFEWQEVNGTIEDFLIKDKQRPMRHGDPMTRYTIVKDKLIGFVLTAHHSLYDGWSMKVIFDEVDKLYHHQDVGSDPPQFASFIANLTPDSEKERRFWISQFDGKDLATYPDPRTATRPEEDSRMHHYVDVVRPGGSDVTMSNLIRAAWAMVIGRHANTQDAYFGAVLMGRNAPVLDIERMAGPTITTVPLCISMDPDQTIASFLQQVKSQSIDMIPYEHTGLQNIKTMSVEAKRACNFQNLLVIQPDGSEDIASKLWNEKAIFARGEMVTLTYSLILECRLYPDKIRLGAQYRQSELPSVQIERLLFQLETVLRQLNSAGDDSQSLLRHIDVCSPQDLDEVMRWNAKTHPYRSQTIHRTVESIAPQKVAVAAWDGQFTYRELNTLADGIAQNLRMLGIGREVFVPLCFDKSAWAVVAMLSILKAGGAYFCLDPKHPIERNELILQDTGSKVILVGEQYAHLFPEYHTMVIDSTTKGLPLEANSYPEAHATDPAFLVFTSGSTGVPKGIVMEHGAFCSGASEHCKALNINSESRVLQFASYTYDVSMGEILSTLMHGGCVCVPSEAQRLNDLAAAINAFQVNWMFLTPTVAAFLHPAQLPTLKHLVLGGEHCTHENIRTWSKHVHLTNSYGPAECAVWCAHNPGITEGDDPSSLGQSIGATLWIVNPDSDSLAPIGAIGELVIEGPALARGYWNDSRKTAGAFIENPPWALGSSRRFYRTGDLVRYGPDGMLHIAGRKDHQVKFHGQRIELGEIEYHLSRVLPKEKYCVAELVHSRIVAFLSSRTFDTTEVSEASPVASELRDVIDAVQGRLAKLLPAYMIPTAYVSVPQLPMTAGGKVDRRKLRRLLSQEQLQACTIQGRDMAVRTVTTDRERALQSFWAQVLELEADKLGKDTNFFQSGGDSIRAMKLSAAARRAGITLSVQDVFLQPVLEDMATVMSTKEVFEESLIPFSLLDDDSILREVSGTFDDVLPATDYQRWTLGCNLLKTRGYLNFFSYNIKGSLDVLRLRAACHRVLNQHPILRTEFVVLQRRLVQIVRPLQALDVSFQMVDSASQAFEDSASHPARFGCQLVRFYLVHIAPEEHNLLLRISHAQYDGISFPMISEDIKCAYSEAELVPAAPFVTFVQAASKHTPVLEAERFYKDLLLGARMTEVVAQYGPTFAARVDQSLKRTVQAPKLSSITFATIAKAAWSIVLSRLSSSSDIVFGQVSTGRNRAIDNIDIIVGPCMNLLPVRVDTAVYSTYAALMNHLQKQHLDMIPYETYGFQHIIDRCTSWPKWTRFSSILQHTNFNIGIDEAEQRSDLVWQIDGIVPEHDVSDVWIWTGPKGDDFSIDFSYSSTTIPAHVAGQMLDMLCEVIEQVAADPAGEYSTASYDTLLPVSREESPNTREQYTCDPDPAVMSHVRDVWSVVFGDVPKDSDQPYFEIQGDMVTAAQLAFEYQKRGYKVCVEDVIRHPSIISQCLLLTAMKLEAADHAEQADP